MSRSELTKTKKLTLLKYYSNIFPVKESKKEYPANSIKSLLFDHSENYSLEFTKSWLDMFAESTTRDGHSETQDISLCSFYSNFVESNLNQPNIMFN